jgi:hypothetical protein
VRILRPDQGRALVPVSKGRGLGRGCYMWLDVMDAECGGGLPPATLGAQGMRAVLHAGSQAPFTHRSTTPAPPQAVTYIVDGFLLPPNFRV